MRSRDVYAARCHEPAPSEIAAWRTFANLAAEIGTGRRNAWGELRGVAKGCRRLRVFGHNSARNPCIQLIHMVLEAADSAAPDRFRDRLAHLASEVIRLCDFHTELRRAALHG